MRGNFYNQTTLFQHLGHMTFWFIVGFEIAVLAQLVLHGKRMKDVDERIELMKLKLKSQTIEEVQAALLRQKVSASQLDEEPDVSFLSSF